MRFRVPARQTHTQTLQHIDWIAFNICYFRGVYQYLWYNLSIRAKSKLTMVWPMSLRRCLSISVVEIAGRGSATNMASLLCESPTCRLYSYLSTHLHLSGLVYCKHWYLFTSLFTANIDTSLLHPTKLVQKTAPLHCIALDYISSLHCPALHCTLP